MTLKEVEALLEELAVKLEPLGDRVAVIPDEGEDITSGGIYIPDTVEEEQKQMGTVIAYGDGSMIKDQPKPEEHVAVGDKVLFGMYAGDDMQLKKVDGTEVKVKILHVDAILSLCNLK